MQRRNAATGRSLCVPATIREAARQENGDCALDGAHKTSATLFSLFFFLVLCYPVPVGCEPSRNILFVPRFNVHSDACIVAGFLVLVDRRANARTPRVATGRVNGAHRTLADIKHLLLLLLVLSPALLSAFKRPRMTAFPRPRTECIGILAPEYAGTAAWLVVVRLLRVL